MIQRELIPYPQAWTASTLGGKEPLVEALDAQAVREVDVLASALRGRSIATIRCEDVPGAAIARTMSRVRAEVLEGRGIAIVRGPDPARYDPQDYARVYWALGTHLGRGAVQSIFNDHVARVERNPDLPWRGTTTDMELRPHTDFHELMSLASVSLPESGGVSGFVSSLAVHNEILAARPDLLEPLYEGWYHVSPGTRAVSERKVPIYSCLDGKVSCFHNRVFFAKPEEAPEPFPARLAEAIEFLDRVCAREDMLLEFTLQPGEIVFWHNFVVMHSRTAFHDGARHRLLLRLWLNVPNGRPLAEEVRERARIVDRDHLERRAP